MKFLAAFVIFLIFLSFPSSGQTKILQVINPAGGTGSTSGVTLDWSLGQIAVTTLVSEQAILTQGLLQENILITQISVPSGMLPEIKVFPNPTSGHLVITVSGSEPLFYFLTDVDGKLLLQGQCMDIESTLDLTGLPHGEYILNISDNQVQHANSYKIIKL